MESSGSDGGFWWPFRSPIRQVFAFYEKLGAFGRAFIIPVLFGLLLWISRADTYVNMLGIHIIWPVVAVLALQSLLSYWEGRVARLEVQRAQTIREVTEKPNRLVEEKSETLKSTLLHHAPDARKTVLSAAGKLKRDPNLAALNRGLHDVMLTYVRHYRGYKDANLVTYLLAPGVGEIFTLVGVQKSAGATNIQRRASQLRTSGQASFAVRSGMLAADL